MTHSSWRQNCLNQIQQRFKDCDLGEQGKALSKTRLYLVSGAVATGMIAFAVMRSASVTNATIPDVIKLDEVTQSKATAAARVSQKDEQIQQIRPENFDLQQFPVTDANSKHWRNLLWTTAVVEPKETFVAQGLSQVLLLMQRSGLTEQQRRTVQLATKTATQLYVSDTSFYREIGQKFLQTIDRSSDPEWVAVSLSALAQAGVSKASLQELMQKVKLRFPKWSEDLYLVTTLRDIEESFVTQTPPIADLLAWQIAPEQLHMYVFCQRDRYVLCRAVLKDRDGQFVRHSNGTLWSVPLLLKSLHNLSWNFERGETPQGVYRVEGVRPQENDEFFRAYGNFDLVKLFLPFETGTKEFLPGSPGPFQGSLSEYVNLLPPSWRSHWGMQQSYWAGKIGRNFFRIHGSGEAPNFFPGKDKYGDSYSWNPTIGCLSALELYNEKGQLVKADMPKILKALEIVGGKDFTGYVIVVNLPRNTRQPMNLQEIEQALAQTQKVGALQRTPR